MVVYHTNNVRISSLITLKFSSTQPYKPRQNIILHAHFFCHQFSTIWLTVGFSVTWAYFFHVQLSLIFFIGQSVLNEIITWVRGFWYVMRKQFFIIFLAFFVFQRSITIQAVMIFAAFKCIWFRTYDLIKTESTCYEMKNSRFSNTGCCNLVLSVIQCGPCCKLGMRYVWM